MPMNAAEPESDLDPLYHFIAADLFLPFMAVD
jgi:hypothetical protein